MLPLIFSAVALLVMYLSLAAGIVGAVLALVTTASAVYHGFFKLCVGRPKPAYAPDIVDVTVEIAVTALMLFIAHWVAGWYNLDLTAIPFLR